jgi:MFS family permease
VPFWTSDQGRLCLAAFLRATATGLGAVLLALYLARLHVGSAAFGLVVAAGLAGAALASLLATLRGDRLGRRRFLIGLTVLGGAGALAVPLVTAPLALCLCAFLGMLNGMGRDRGAALVLEQAALPETTTDEGRTALFAAYNVLQDAGHALGSLLAITPALLVTRGLGDLLALRVSFGLLALLALAPLPLYLGLSPAVERHEPAPTVRLTPSSRRLLARISVLFALDSLGGGFLSTAFLSLFFSERFSVGAETLGLLFFGARVLNALSHVGAALLARRIGLVNTMVFTHVPSSLLLVTVAFAPSFPVAAALFLLREGLVEMDVPTRQSYVMAVVRPEERTFASGLTHLVRMGAWALAPAFAGLLATASLMTPLVVGAALKVAYDGLLYAACRRTRPPEEEATGPLATPP